MKETKIEHIKFHTGTQEMAEHEQFIKSCNEKDIEIIGFWVTYNDRPHQHIPHYLHYVIKTTSYEQGNNRI
jgi:hypothetical protein